MALTLIRNATIVSGPAIGDIERGDILDGERIAQGAHRTAGAGW
jgi:hypothetical protein